ncbi:MAG: TonB family protein [Bryobacteraceae bacterium]|nr:TonB family protein [Bryobacteraceae bacterium]MCX7603131.1 TonB family protein [Bryobacteraceae bacterium]
MQAATGIDAPRAGAAPRLLPEVRDEDARRRHAIAGTGAVLFHAAVLGLIAWMPAAPAIVRPAPQVIVDVRKSTPLVAPPLPFRLTQKEPQRGKPAAEVDITALMPRPAIQQPQARGSARPFQPPPGAPETRRGRELDFDIPPVEMAQAIPPAPVPGSGLPEAPRTAPPKRDNPFEPVGGPQTPTAQPRLALPPAGVAETVKSLARGGGGTGLTVGDVPGTGGVSEGLVQTPRPGRPGSTLELLSDPKGIDFRPYLVQVLAAVRRNWYAVMPESVRFGARGRTVIQFSISRSGQVPKLVIAVPSGMDALDRAAVASISASNPFPPLPAEYTGAEIRLQLVFSYNMPR